MNTFNIVFTTANFILTAVSVGCAIYSAKQTTKQSTYASQQVDAAYKQLEITSRQTEIAQKQLEKSYEPDFPTTTRLESIANSIQHLNGTLKDGLQIKK